MSLSDADLEARLRNHWSRVDTVAPDPWDLVAAARERHHRQRRFELKLAAAGLAVALAVVGVPLLSGLIENRNIPAGPGPEPPSTSVPGSLFDQPTRGALAGDERWLAEVAALSWETGDRTSGETLEPPGEARTVAFAGDVPGGRAALVLARPEGRGTAAWFTGPPDAEPAEMTLATAPSLTSPSDRPGLWDRPDPAGPAVLVVVAVPGDQIEVMTGRTVTASGEIQERWVPVATTDGVSAVSVVPLIWPGAPPSVRVLGGGPDVDFPNPLLLSDRFFLPAAPAPELADPRRLRDSVDETQLQWAIDVLAGQFTDELPFTLLLAGGPVEGSSAGAVLVEATFPSGATVAYAASWPDPQVFPQPPPHSTTRTWPAGTAAIDRVLAVELADALVISGPSQGALAEIRLADGTPVATLPLMDGAGIAPPQPSNADSVRILDESGAELVRVPITGPGE